MIRKVKLKNWRSHRETELEFSEGTNAIIGLMGTGKSSILSAISFALFGTFPSHKSREVKLDELIMRKPQKKDESTVVVKFDLEEDKYEVKRTIERNKGTTVAEIRKNGKLLDTGTTRTTELVEKYLKVDYELFSKAIYSEQNGLHYFLEIPKGQRMEKIDKLLKIDRFEKARSNTTTVINRMKDRAEDKKGMLEDMEEREEFGKMEELKKEIENIQEDKENIKENLRKIKKGMEELKKREKNIKERRDEVEELKKNKNKVEGKISNLEEEIENSEEKFEDIETDNIEDKLEERNEEREELEEEIEQKDKERDKVHKNIQKIKASIQNLQNRIEKLKGVEGKCPICDNELTEKHRRNLLEKRYEKMESLEKKIPKYKKQEEDLEEEIKGYKKSRKEVKEKSRKLEKMMEEREELEDKKKRLEAFKKKLGKQKEKLEEIMEEYSNEKYDAIQKKLRNLSSKKSQYESDLKNKKQFLKEKKKSLEKLKEKKELFKEYKKEVKKLDFLIEDMKKFRNALEKTQVNLRERFVEAVNATMNDIWEDLYPYGDYTGIRLNAKEGDYNLELKENNSWLSVEGVISGGERTAACLTLRVAFALVLAPNLKWLVLDEPTHNLDERAVEDLAEVLRDKINQFVDQVFLITHNKKLEDAVTGHLYILKRDKEENEPTKTINAQSPKD
ncbi:MAG: AAA family ATPase [Candidatus Aenigmatarchaeota archaeon]